MLNILHNKINNIIPIIGIQTINDTISIEYVDPDSVTNEQNQQIENILSSWPLDSAKLAKISILDLKWNSLIKEGYVTPYSWKLGLSTSDVSLLTGAFLLAKEAYALALSPQASIIDMNGVSHSISIEDFTSLMIQYGQYRTNLSIWYANIKNQIEQASTIEEIDNIII